VQIAPPAQGVAHAPQLATSFARSTQMPLHAVRPAGQTQVPAEHCVPPLQTWLHPPQLWLFVCVSTQAPLQSVSWAAQLLTHWPPLQSSPGKQEKPQPPQSSGLEVVSTHCPWQLLVPRGQTQPPVWHCVPPVHARPHAPQLASLDERSTHEPEQLVCPRRHAVWQVPPPQDSPVAQALLHMPQFSGSEVMSTQTPLQSS
jgi:hypothetical protein